MSSSTSPGLQPLTEAETTRCRADGTDFSGLHVWQGDELHVVRPLPSATGSVDAAALAMGVVGLVALGCVLLLPGLETLAIGLPGGLFALVLGWRLFSERRSSWTLRIQSKGFVYARSGRWFPHGNRILRGSLGEVSATWRRSARGPGCRLRARLGGYTLDLLSQTLSDAEELAAVWALYRGGLVAEALPPAVRMPSGMGQVLVTDRLPHAVQLHAGQARLSAEAPVAPVFVHRGHNLWGVPVDRYREIAPRLWRVAAAGLPHVQPALAMVVLDGAPAVLSVPAEGLDLHQISQRHGPMPPSVCLELAARLAETIAAAAAGGAESDPIPGHGRLEAGMVLLDETGCLSILEYGIQPAPRPPDQALFSFGSLPRVFSPEYLKGSAPTDDRYALGVLLLELLGGRPPFWDVSTLEFLQASLRPESQGAMVHALLDACDEAMGPGVRALVGALLAFAPEARPDVGTLAARCRALAAEAGGPLVEAWAGQHDLSVPVEQDGPLCGQVHVVRVLASLESAPL